VVLPSIIGVRPEPGIDPGALTTRIDREVPGVEALTRERAVQENPGVQGVSNSANVILGLAFLVVTLVVAFFFLILTSQNAMTTTLLRAIGARPAYLVRALILQIVVVMAAGVALGVVLTLAVEAAARDSVPTDLDPATLAATVGAVTALALGGGLVSIRRVLRVDPLRATVNAGRTL
ncbi:MAG: FtsX-like permease family protein, partial [Actinobacteria bacterium]|nr:FtsX-like permease family protein [Actinomycetota bacterium]NIS36292.1 FtsX-like permease family protein [Actinomycetota bacterium]NIT98640.1 FtsX-like permease family protein [Actinomycetota bacterium]NIU22256.1 FtsX-like permease family protein [Actinomycetota bacterium]NIU70838.1 FtsX-like permease family protein [Actinomycetota bacterium]